MSLAQPPRSAAPGGSAEGKERPLARSFGRVVVEAASSTSRASASRRAAEGIATIPQFVEPGQEETSGISDWQP